MNYTKKGPEMFRIKDCKNKKLSYSVSRKFRVQTTFQMFNGFRKFKASCKLNYKAPVMWERFCRGIAKFRPNTPPQPELKFLYRTSRISLSHHRFGDSPQICRPPDLVSLRTTAPLCCFSFSLKFMNQSHSFNGDEYISAREGHRDGLPC